MDGRLACSGGRQQRADRVMTVSGDQEHALRPDDHRRYRAASWPTDGEMTVSGDRGARGAKHVHPRPDDSRRYRAAEWPQR